MAERESHVEPACRFAEPGVALAVSRAVYRGELDLSARPRAPAQGWEAGFDVAIVRDLRRQGAGAADARRFITFVAAMERVRDSEPLWRRAQGLYEHESWLFSPREVVERPLGVLRETLTSAGVSQKHQPDSAAWHRIAASLVERAASVVNDAIETGTGHVPDLLAALRARGVDGRALFPLLRGEKIGPMWVRMLVDPGEARLTGLDALPVAVDTHTRTATECLGVVPAIPGGCDERAVRAAIQEAWMRDVRARGAEGPPALAGTCAALDPALWFFGKWGCSFCKRWRARKPIAAVCSRCTLPTRGWGGLTRPA